MTEPTITVEVDTEIGAAYVGFSDARVARTEEYSEDINVDLDALGVVVGIELLDTSVVVPLDDLVAKYHITTTTLARLLASLKFQPTPSTVMSGSGSSSRPVYRGIRSHPTYTSSYAIPST
jgi:uncharacterized protein YuzE